MSKTTKTCQEGRSPGQDMNLGLPEYKAGMLTTRPQWSVTMVLKSIRWMWDTTNSESTDEDLLKRATNQDDFEKYERRLNVKI
jgi:hypothetical protein